MAPNEGALAAASEAESRDGPAGPIASPYTVVLYYKYVRVADSDADVASFVASHEQLCRDLALAGRVRIAMEGINGTLGGAANDIAQYIATMKQDPRFEDVDWKTSASTVTPFPELLVRHSPEIVTLELPEDQCDPKQGGEHLTPARFHEEQLNCPRDSYALIDVRNVYEYNIGHFDGAVNPNTRRFSQFPEWVRQELPALQEKDKILMYCTGGIRCEKASSYLKHLGLRNVYQLEGGIHRYLEQFPDGGHFQGKNFVFDQRVSMASNDETIAGKCRKCEEPYDIVSGLRCQYCRTHVMLCDGCRRHVPPLEASVPLERTREEEEPFVFCSDHAFLVEGSADQLMATTTQLCDELAKQRGHGRKGKRRSLRKQLEIVEQARIRALPTSSD